jgi:hypothetical protein
MCQFEDSVTIPLCCAAITGGSSDIRRKHRAADIVHIASRVHRPAQSCMGTNRTPMLLRQISAAVTCVRARMQRALKLCLV